MNQSNLPTSSSKSAPMLTVLNIFKCKSSSRYGLAHILPMSSSKSAPMVTVFNIFKCKSNPGYSPVRFLPTTFADQGPKPQKQRPYFGHHGSHFTRKKTGFRARESFQAWIHAFPSCYTSYTTWWWCGWHDGEHASHQPSVTRIFSNWNFRWWYTCRVMEPVQCVDWLSENGEPSFGIEEWGKWRHVPCPADWKMVLWILFKLLRG